MLQDRLFKLFTAKGPAHKSPAATGSYASSPLAGERVQHCTYAERSFVVYIRYRQLHGYRQHLWFSGKIGHCHCLAPGSIPGECSFCWVCEVERSEFEESFLFFASTRAVASGQDIQGVRSLSRIRQTQGQGCRTWNPSC